MFALAEHELFGQTKTFGPEDRIFFLLTGGFHYSGSRYRNFWLMNAQVGDFSISRGPPSVPLTQISRKAVFVKSQNPRTQGPSVLSALEIDLRRRGERGFLKTQKYAYS